MYQDNVVLCGAIAYEQKYYFNKYFNYLPDHVKKELQIMSIQRRLEESLLWSLMIRATFSLRQKRLKQMAFMMISVGH